MCFSFDVLKLESLQLGVRTLWGDSLEAQTLQIRISIASLVCSKAETLQISVDVLIYMLSYRISKGSSRYSLEPPLETP